MFYLFLQMYIHFEQKTHTSKNKKGANAGL